MRWTALVVWMFASSVWASTAALPAVQTDPRDFRISFATSGPSSAGMQNPGVLVDG